MSEAQPAKKKFPIKFFIAILVGGALALCMICGVIANLSGDKTPTPVSVAEGQATAAPVAQAKATKTPRPSATPKPSATPRPTATATPDPKEEAQAVQLLVMTIMEPGDQATERVKKALGATSPNIFVIYETGKAAAETWKVVRGHLYKVRPVNPNLKDAVESLQLCAMKREDAYRALMTWCDSQKTSDVAKFKEAMESSDAYMLRGLAIIIALAGTE